VLAHGIWVALMVTPVALAVSWSKKRSPHLRDLAGDFRLESRNLDIALRRANSSCLQPASRNGWVVS
jgi:hypothetical protein